VSSHTIIDLQYKRANGTKIPRTIYRGQKGGGGVEYRSRREHDHDRSQLNKGKKKKMPGERENTSERGGPPHISQFSRGSANRDLPMGFTDKAVARTETGQDKENIRGKGKKKFCENLSEGSELTEIPTCAGVPGLS